jgi:hypothetical protein
MIDGTEPPPDRHGIADITNYLGLVTSEHNQKPKYIEMLIALLQPFGDTTWLETHYYLYYDIDIAVGVQLDAVGEWVGRNRYLTIPIVGYFSYDTDGLGWDEAPWWREGIDPLTGTVALADPPYRQLLYAVIEANHWDGTIPGAYKAYDKLFEGTGYSVLVQDWGDGTMGLALIGPRPPDIITAALFDQGELDLKPAAIGMWHLYPTVWPAGPGTPSNPGTPLFAFDVEDATCAGWDVGAWTNATYKPPKPGALGSIWDDGSSIWDDGASHWDSYL